MDESPKPIDYADPQVESAPPHSGRKETVDLFREAPAIATIGLCDVLIWVVSFVVVLAVFLWFVAQMFKPAWD